MIDKTGMLSAVMFSKNILTKFREAAIRGKLFLENNEDLKLIK